MKKQLILVFALFFGIAQSYAQKALEENQFEGYVILKDGTKKEGIIEIKNPKQPWSFQEPIKFFDKSLLSKEKIKKNEKEEYKPGDAQEYSINGKRYVLVSYTNFDNASNSSNGLNGGLAALKGATQNKFFAEVYKEGKISVFRFFNSPPDFAVGVGEEQIRKNEEYVRECYNTFDILIERDGEKAKAFDEINIKKFFKDCELVVNKYEEGKYTKKPVKGVKSFIKDGMIRGEKLAAAAMELIDDYNANCGK